MRDLFIWIRSPPSNSALLSGSTVIYWFVSSQGSGILCVDGPRRELGGCFKLTRTDRLIQTRRTACRFSSDQCRMSRLPNRQQKLSTHLGSAAVVY